MLKLSDGNGFLGYADAYANLKSDFIWPQTLIFKIRKDLHSPLYPLSAIQYLPSPASSCVKHTKTTNVDINKRAILPGNKKRASVDLPPLSFIRTTDRNTPCPID